MKEIKVSLNVNTNARSSLMTQAEVEESKPSVDECPARPAVNLERQKTNIVLKTVEEVESFLRIMGLTHPKSTNERRALDRVAEEVSHELTRRGYRIERDGKYDPELVQIEGARGDPPSHVDLEQGMIAEVKGGDLGWKKTVDGEKVPSEDLRDVKIDVLGPEKVLVWDGLSYDTPKWIEYEDIQGIDWDEMEQREIRAQKVEKRKQADMDALLDLCKRHAKQEAERVWPSGTVPVGDIEFQWNYQLSYHGGYYYGRTATKRGGFTPVIELCPHRYFNRGLNELLEIVRHELIHAWQDFHPNGHPGDTHKHHGYDFKQWVDDLNTR